MNFSMSLQKTMASVLFQYPIAFYYTSYGTLKHWMRLTLMSAYLCYWSPPDCKLLGSKVVVQNQIPSFGKIWEFSQSSHPCKVHNTSPSRRVCNGDTFPHPIAAYSFLGKVHLLESFPINGIKILFWNFETEPQSYPLVIHRLDQIPLVTGQFMKY